MSIDKVSCGCCFWFDKYRRCISLTYHISRLLHPSLWFWHKNNGAVKGQDSCYDFNMEILGLHFSYSDFSYNRERCRV